MNEIITISGEDILLAKSTRAAYLQELSKNKGVLISLLLNIPGNIKDRSIYRLFAMKKMEELISEIVNHKGSIEFKEMKWLTTGPEGFLIVKNLSPKKVKKITTHLERTKKSGRILDLDVLTNRKKIERKKKRSCYLCDNLAFNCARKRKHTIKELLSHIHFLINKEINDNDNNNDNDKLSNH